MLTHNSTDGGHPPQSVRHAASGLCAQGKGGAVHLVACDAKDYDQMWIFGQSGRVCTRYGDLCMSVETPKEAPVRRLSFV